MSTDKIKIRLQRHEKFALREGWLNKGLLLVPTDETAFVRKDAPDKFGIGNNMVKSLRYWMKTLGLTNDKGSELSEIGRIIAENDIYLEDRFTLWLLHSIISKNVDEATTWYMFFNKCEIEEMSKEQIEKTIAREITKYTNGQSFSETSLKNDIDVLLNMYSKDKAISDPEDKNISPFAVLGLVKSIDGMYSKNHVSFNQISEWNILYELFLKMDGRDSIAIEELATGEKGVSAIYQLTLVALNEFLDRIEALGYVHVDRTAGLDIVYKTSEITPIQIIEKYYQIKSR